ncbi:hypothetical protein CK203_058401 [Vitis vinifera]|uniref:Reverse transcriptase RNase H-like domain-containing protein n=1 Tax=Vitis vinifera TaxID=29760 RepID=A0A438GI57_VITVI|nr:hypothetical protein CK203_058401 [Vitis vinifera]
MTLELNIFHLCKKHIHLEEEEGLEEVCMIDTIVEEHCDQRMRREEILPLFNEEETQRAAKEEPPKLILKPLPTELKYAYLEEDKQCPILWVSPTQVVPKKSGITVVQNDKGEDVSTRLTIGWRACIDYRRLNVVTRKDHFPLPFIDQIEIDVEDQEKTLSRAHLAPMHTGECLSAYAMHLQLSKDALHLMNAWLTRNCLNRCIEKDLVLNWEKCHFMVQQGIVLGHIISKQGIEVDKAKVELIVKLPSPTNVKGMDPLASRVQSLDQRQERSGECGSNHLSRLAIAHNSHGLPINDGFPEESLMLVEVAPWYAHIANYLVTGEVPSEWKAQDKKYFFAKIHAYYWEEPFLFKYCAIR